MTHPGQLANLVFIFRSPAQIGFESPCRFPDRKCAAREAWRQVHLLRTANEL